MLPSIEQHVDWISDCIAYMRNIGARSIEALESNEDDWVAHVADVASISLRSTCSSWYVGANIPGRPRVFMPYIGGFPIYVQKCNEVLAEGFEGFVLDATASEPPTVRFTERWQSALDPDVLSPADIAAGRIPIV
jgi:cyclohexanone monooxygenase